MSSPSIVPTVSSDVYLVLDDLGKIGRAYREVDEERATREDVIRDLISGQFNDPVRIICFNADQGYCRDVTAEIAEEIKEWAESKGEQISPGLRDFIDWQLERAARMRGRLVMEQGHGQ
jgi:hypothetical protein